MSWVVMECPNGSCNVRTYDGNPDNRTDRCCPSCGMAGVRQDDDDFLEDEDTPDMGVHRFDGA
jgi:hypothetical protein